MAINYPSKIYIVLINYIIFFLLLGDEILSVNGSILQGKSHGRILITSFI